MDICVSNCHIWLQWCCELTISDNQSRLSRTVPVGSPYSLKYCQNAQQPWESLCYIVYWTYEFGFCNNFFFLILACLWTFFSKHVVVECRVEPQGCVPFSLHKCFKWWWLAIPEKHTITKPLINSNFNLRQPKGLTYRVLTITK